MSTITSLLSNLLNDYKKSAGITDSGTDATTTNTGTTNTGQYGDAYVLDLSQAAQDILDSSSSGSSSVISLSDAQKQKLHDILDKYKDAPVNNDTLSAIYADLQKAGLSPDELSAIQQAKDFNPTAILLKILAGGSDSGNGASPTETTLSGLGSTASGTPLGDLLAQYQAKHTSSATGTLADALNSSSSTDNTSSSSTDSLSALLAQYQANNSSAS